MGIGGRLPHINIFFENNINPSKCILVHSFLMNLNRKFFIFLSKISIDGVLISLSRKERTEIFQTEKLLLLV
jgi:hypothetical protein